MNGGSEHSFLETSLQNLTIDYLVGSDTTLWPGWGGRNITVAFNKFYYLTEGDFHIEIDGRVYEGKPGQLFLLPSNSDQYYHAYNSNTARKKWIHFNSNCGKKDLFELLNVGDYIEVDDPDYISGLFDSILNHGSHHSVEDILIVKSDILQLLSYYLSKAQLKYSAPILDSRFEAVLRYIDEHISEEIRLTDLSQLVYLNPNYFIRCFKNRIGMSPMEYILMTRVNRAKYYLQSTALPIKDISFMCGFSTVYYFDRIFKRYTGITPSIYRSSSVRLPYVDRPTKNG